MGEFAVIFLGACLVNNLVLNAMLGLPPALAVAKKIPTAIGMTQAMLLALTSATLVSYPLHYYVLVPLDLSGLETFSFIIVITLAMKTVELVLQRVKPALHEQLAVFFPLTLINSAALGVPLLNSHSRHGLLGSLFYGLGAAVGFGLVVVALAAMQERLMPAAIPAPFRGIAIILITLGIMSMAFMGFNGLVSY